MKTHAKKFENMFRIFDILQEHTCKPASVLAAELSVNERTVYRYVSEVNLAFSPYEVIEPGKAGYRLRKSPFLELLKSRDDAVLLAAGASMPMGKAMENRVKLPSAYLDALAERLEVRSRVPSEFIHPLVKSLVEGWRASVDYADANGKTWKLDVLTLKLVSEHNILYLVVLDTADTVYKLLAIDRIRTFVLSQSKADVKELARHIGFVNSAWGIMVTGTVYLATIRVDRALTDYFTRTPLHPGQDLTEKDGIFILTLPVHNLKELVRWSLRFGGKMKLLGPEELVNEAMVFLDGMRDLYKDQT